MAVETPVADGTDLATDVVSGEHVQRIKVTFGAANSATLVSDADPLPVELANTSIAITAVSLPLATGAATAAAQATLIGHVDGIETLLSGTIAVSAAALPLPAGAATSAKQDTIIGHLDGVEGSLTAIAGSVAGATPAGTNFIGTVASPVSLIDVTLSLDTNAYADGDVLAATQEIAGAVRTNAGCALLQSLTVHDEDDVGQALDLIFFSANSALGTENAAPSITDAAARDILGIVSIASADFKDFGGVKIASLKGIGLILKGATSATSVYVGAIIRGAGTFTAAGIRLRLGVVQA